MQTIMINDAELHYIEAGQGDPLVLVHGSLSDFRTWGRQVIAFAQYYRVIAYSRRYHYPNANPEHGVDYSVEQHADDLIGFMDALGLPRVRLVGSSFGAYVSLVATNRRPDRIISLVVGEPPMFPILQTDQSGSLLLDTFLRTIWTPSQRHFHEGNNEAGVRLFYEGITAPGAYDRLPRAVRTGMLQNAAPMKAEASARAIFPPFTGESARNLTIPVLLLTGETSPAIFHRITDLLENVLPQTERAEIPHASHSMHTDNPGKYNELVLEFLARTTQVRGVKY